MREEFDIIIVGAGPAGMAAAVGFAEAGFRAALIDRIDPVKAAEFDWRTTALLQPSLRYLADIGVGPAVEAASEPLEVLRIVDLGAESDGRSGLGRDFEAHETDGAAFGRNIANRDLKRALNARAADLETLTLIAPAEILSVARREDAALLTLEADGALRSLAAPLIVAADGRDSRLRAEAGIETRRFDHGQRTTICFFRHPEPHRNVSIEFYSEGGPFTLVPYLDDADGAPRSSLVWMKRNAGAAALEALSDDEFAAAATAQSGHVFGQLTLASPRKSFPIETLLADRFAARRLALMAETAHAAPPVGAQGLNMSLSDAAALLDQIVAARAAGRDLGGAALLSAYEKARRPDVATRVGAVAALTMAADGAVAPMRAARRFGLAAAHGLRPVRAELMRRGLGVA